MVGSPVPPHQDHEPDPEPDPGIGVSGGPRKRVEGLWKPVTY